MPHYITIRQSRYLSLSLTLSLSTQNEFAILNEGKDQKIMFHSFSCTENDFTNHHKGSFFFQMSDKKFAQKMIL